MSAFSMRIVIMNGSTKYRGTLRRSRSAGFFSIECQSSNWNGTVMLFEYAAAMPSARRARNNSVNVFPEGSVIDGRPGSPGSLRERPLLVLEGLGGHVLDVDDDRLQQQLDA